MTWSDAADALQAALEHAGRLVDGEDPDAPVIPQLDLTGLPDEATVVRLRELLAQVPGATSAVAEAKDAIGSQIAGLDRHRDVAGTYLRTL